MLCVRSRRSTIGCLPNVDAAAAETAEKTCNKGFSASSARSACPLTPVDARTVAAAAQAGARPHLTHPVASNAEMD